MFLAKCFDGIIINNKEMILVKKLLLVVLVALCVVPAVAAAPTYTLTPWPCGVIAHCGTRPVEETTQ